VLFINDSKATNPASTAPALAAFPPDKPATRIHWIVGGLPKGDDLDECAPYFGNVARPPIPSARPGRCLPNCSPRTCRWRSEMLCEAMREAIAAASPAMSCCCRPPAPASTSSATTRRAATRSARSSRPCWTPEPETGGGRAADGHASSTSRIPASVQPRRPGNTRYKPQPAQRLAIWWREIDRVLLGLVLALMAIGTAGGRRRLAGQRAAPVDRIGAAR
jgi:hypothetical protein